MYSQYFLYYKKKGKTGKTDSRDELHNTAKYDGHFLNFYRFVYFDSL